MRLTQMMMVAAWFSWLRKESAARIFRVKVSLTQLLAISKIYFIRTNIFNLAVIGNKYRIKFSIYQM